MTGAPGSGALVVDTMVTSWLADERPNVLADRYRELTGSLPVLLTFQNFIELRYRALRAQFGRASPPKAGTSDR